MATVDLRLGDCLDILPTLPDMCADAIITDVPYGTTACKWDVIIPLDLMWAQVKRLCKGAFVTTASQPFTSVLVTSALDMFRYEWMWNKRMPTGYLDANRKPLKVHENVVVFSKNGHTYNPQKWQSTPYKKNRSNNAAVYNTADRLNGENLTGERYPTTHIDISNANQSGKEHPTQKPVALYEYLIKTYTNPGDTVLDFCMGSGTTGIAAIKTGRNFIGIEKERNYFEIAQRRIMEAQQTVMEFA
jgi:site-specific DNA-methyltransferase (adenine-specific)